MYANHRQESWERGLVVVVRTTGDPLLAASTIRRAVKDADPTLAVRDVRTLNDIVGGSFAPRRFALGLASCFAAAVVIVLLGVVSAACLIPAVRAMRVDPLTSMRAE